MTIPIGRFLVEFAPPKPAPAGPLPTALIEAVASHRTEAQVIAAIEDAHCAGYRAAGVDAERAVARREAEMAAAHAAELTAARAAWAAAEGKNLAHVLGSRLDALEARIAAVAADLLRPLLPQALAARTVAELKDAIGTLLTGGDPPTVAVSGPPDLLAALRRALGGRGGVSFHETDEAEITVSSGETTIRSALQGWADRLAQELAPPA